MNTGADNEWELCKENIQPLRQGRRMGELSKALKNDSTFFRSQVQEFEMQIRQLDSQSEEQLNVWYNYITWMEQHFPTSSEEPLKLMKRCAQHFNGFKDMYQNEKLLLIWLKLADLMDEPADIFQYQLDQDIGTSFAIFYKAWGEHFEIIGATKKAGELYDLGINRSAQPIDLLIDCRRDFDIRMAKKLENKDTDITIAKHKSRIVLGGLKVDKSGRVGNDRSKNKASSSSKTSSRVSKHNVSQASNFAIYGDTNPAAELHTTSAGQIRQLPLDSGIHTENKKRMETVKGAKVKQTGGNAASAPKFAIFTEETESSTEIPTPRQGTRTESARKPLSTRKAAENPYQFYDPNKPCDPNVSYKYCKDVIHMGVREVSFEELKAQLPKYKKKGAARTKLCFSNIKEKGSTEMIQDSDYSNQLTNKGAVTNHLEALHSSHETSRKTDYSVRDESVERTEQKHKTILEGSPIEFSDLEAKGSQPSEVTMVLHQIEGNEFGLPNYESTKVLKKNAKIQQTFGTPERTNENRFSVEPRDVHMETPEFTGKSVSKKGNIPREIFDELDETAGFGKLCHSKINVAESAVCGEMLHMLNETKKMNQIERLRCNDYDAMEVGVEPSNLMNNKFERQFTDRVEAKTGFPDCGSGTVYDEMDLGVAPLDDDSLLKCTPSKNTLFKCTPSKNSTKIYDQSAMITTAGFHKYDNHDLEQLRQLSAVSGVTLDIFGDKNLVTSALQKNNCSSNDFNGSNDSLIHRLKLLDTSDLSGGGDVMHLGELQFQKSVLSKTPRSKLQSAFVSKGTNQEIWAPSPTVNTKDACDNVRSMFSTTLDHEKFDLSFDGPTEIDKTFEAQFCFGSKKKDETSGITQPNGFSIFTDSIEIEQQNAKDANIQSKGFTAIDGNKNSQPEVQSGFVTNPSFPVFSDDTMSWSTKVKPNQTKEESFGSGGFSVYTDVRNTSQPHLISNTMNTTKIPNATSICDENPLLVPVRPASTPFTASSDMKSITFGHNISDITSGIKADATTFSSFNKTNLDLSTIQERSNEDAGPDDSRKRSSSSEDEFSNHGCILDVFDANLKTLFVNKAMSQIMASENFLDVNGALPKLQGASMALQIGPRNIRVIRCLFKDGRSATYKAVNNLNQTVSLKISKNVCSVLLWDFYISNQIHQRLSLSPHPFNSLNTAFMKHNLLCKYSDATCVETLFYSEGTLKDLIVLFKKHNQTLDEVLVMLYAHEILRIVHILHAVNILHVDLRPGNFIQADCELTKAGPLALRSLILKGFEKSIDLTLTNSTSVMFVGSSNNESYECAEMRANKPWKYQADFYAAAGTIHMLVFGTHMNTYVEDSSKMLRMCSSTRRDWNFELWNRLFSTLINATHRDILPPLINELASELCKPQNIKMLDDAIMKKNDILMEDD